VSDLPVVIRQSPELWETGAELTKAGEKLCKTGEKLIKTGEKLTKNSQFSAPSGRLPGLAWLTLNGSDMATKEIRYDDPSGSVIYDGGLDYDSEPSPSMERKRYMVKPKLELNKQSYAQLSLVAKTVRDAMTLNAAEFPNSAADVTALDGEVDLFDAAMQAAENGKITQQGLVDAKDAARATLEARLRKLANQVNLAANGDVNIIHDAGMQASNEPTPVILGQVLNLQLTPSAREGELHAKWDGVDGARTYRMQVSTDTSSPPVNWIDKGNSTKTRCSLNHDLVSATKVWVRVCASGANGDGPWSDVARKTVP
jgi:hypothetical protein